MPTVTWIVGADKTDEFRLLARWFRQVSRIRDEFARCMSGDFDPLRVNETASVGFIAAAASCSGLLTLTDYVSIKRGWEKVAPYRLGRCDLWVADPHRQVSWAFEFKQGAIGRTTRPAKIGQLLDQACQDARRVDRLEAHRRFGGLVLTLQEGSRTYEIDEALRLLSARASYCCRLGKDQRPAWIYLEAV